MTFPVSDFINPKSGSYAHHALQKALEDEPNIQWIGQVDEIRYYQVTSSKKLGPKYPVRIWEDKDHESWVECFCAASYPPSHPDTKLIAWFPKHCYHSASVIIYEAQMAYPEDALPLEEEDILSLH